MPDRPYRPCRKCGTAHRNASGYCDAHAALAKARPSTAGRGYGAAWRSVRQRVLAAACIPPAQWHLYDVDHSPAYNPAIEPDHNRYTLTPRLHAEHSRKTASVDGGFGNMARAQR